MRYIVLNINSSFLAKFRFPAREYMRRCNALVRSPCFILTDFRLCTKINLYWKQAIDCRCPSDIPNQAGRAKRGKRLVCLLVQMISRIDSCI